MKELDRIIEFLRSSDGINQFQRAIPAQDPDSIRVDERKKSDHITFLRRLSEQISYFNLNNQEQGNWLSLFNNLDQISTIIVKAATTENLSAHYTNGNKGIDSGLKAVSNGVLPEQDGVSMVSEDLLLVWKQDNPIENGVYKVSQGNESKPFELIRLPTANQKADFDGQIVEVSNGERHSRRFFIQQTISPVIGTSAIIYQRGASSSNDRPPHQALLLSFLHVYGILQEDINLLTGRHLAYYYEKVLQVLRKKAIPDQVHTVFELNKNAAPVLLPAGTLLDAGKTPDGLYKRQYALNNEFIINHAVVNTLKSSFTDRNSAGKKIIYKAEDAQLVKADSGPGFRPLGKAQLGHSLEEKNMIEAKIGFAIASPNFFLAEGERKVSVTLNLKDSTSSPPPKAFEISMTGEEGWINPSFSVKEFSSSILSFEVIIPASSGGIIAYDEQLHGPGYVTHFPVFRCQVLPHAFQLEILSTFNIGSIDISVEADGVHNLILQNDQALQDPGNPVLPFGSQSLLESNFYIGSSEVFNKSIKSLSLKLEWQDPPENFTDHYREYGADEIESFGNNIFTADLYLLAAKNWKTRLLFGQSLFNSQGTSFLRDFQVPSIVMADELMNSGFNRNPDMSTFNQYGNRLSTGFIKLVLTGPTKEDMVYRPNHAPFEAFGHKTYSKVYTAQAIALGQFNSSGDPPTLPNEPYTPTLKSVSLDYTAGDSFYPTSPNGVEQFFSLDIFGTHELREYETAKIVPETPENGALYIGIQDANPPQILSMLFQISDGSAPGNTLLRSPDLSWSYMASDHWKTISAGDILEDSTNGLQKSGLIRLNLGEDATWENTKMTQDNYWLRIMVNAHADGAGNFEAIHLQAAASTLVHKDIAKASYINHLSQPLPPNNISKLVNKVSGIKKIIQDYGSIQGVPPETNDAYFQRVSERLRHKNRTVSGWDYERMTLEKFPQIFKVKCLSHTDVHNQVAPGNIKIVVVPNFRKLVAGDPLQPKCNASLLRDISDYISQHSCSPFVKPLASNPEYETLLVDCKVSFMEGFDPGFYSAKLNEEIKQFLSAWAYDEGKDITFGGKIYRNELLAFVEGRNYVDYVVDFKVYHRFKGPPLGGISKMTINEDFIVGLTPKPNIGVTDAKIGSGFIVGQPVEVARASRPDSILVSEDNHRISAIQTEDFLCSGNKNITIGQMIVKVNFIVQ